MARYGLITQRSRVQIPSLRRTKGHQAVALHSDYQLKRSPGMGRSAPSTSGCCSRLLKAGRTGLGRGDRRAAVLDPSATAVVEKGGRLRPYARLHGDVSALQRRTSPLARWWFYSRTSSSDSRRSSSDARWAGISTRRCPREDQRLMLDDEMLGRPPGSRGQTLAMTVTVSVVWRPVRSAVGRRTAKTDPEASDRSSHMRAPSRSAARRQI